MQPVRDDTTLLNRPDDYAEAVIDVMRKRIPERNLSRLPDGVTEPFRRAGYRPAAAAREIAGNRGWVRDMEPPWETES